MQTRAPAVAGAFYPEDKDELEQYIRVCHSRSLGPGSKRHAASVFGAICPHAGYMYSGPVACHAVDAVASGQPELFIIIGPNHWGAGGSAAATTCHAWQTPLGNIPADHTAASELVSISQVKVDHAAHAKEHSIEVLLPMLQHTAGDFRIVPVSLAGQDKESAGSIGAAVATVAKGRNARIIGSSDFTHYEPNQYAHEQDAALIKPILELDVDRFYDVLEERHVSACGYGAIAATMAACKSLGATRGELLKYATSGDVTGDMSSVVGYGAIVFT